MTKLHRLVPLALDATLTCGGSDDVASGADDTTNVDGGGAGGSSATAVSTTPLEVDGTSIAPPL